MTVRRPFPWETLEAYRRADLEAWRYLRRWAQTASRLAQCLPALEAAIGTRVDLRLRGAQRGQRPPPLIQGIALELEATGPAGHRVLLEVEVPLATVLTARALKRPPPRIHAPSENRAAESLAGGLAALVSAVSRHAQSSPFRVRAAGPSAAVRAAEGVESASFDTATFTVVVEDEAYLARVSLTTPPSVTKAIEWNRDRLRLLGGTPIAIPIVACVFLTTPNEVAALVEGDAWMLGDAPRLRSLRGEVWLAAPDAEYGVRAELVDKGSLVLRGERVELGWSPMIEPDENDALVDAVGDIPVVVRIEVGTVRMSAREWASLVPGDVIEIARKIGDPVALRISGVEVASGELVEVEGEIGVRVLSRFGAERAR